jgi:hypothetical protein
VVEFRQGPNSYGFSMVPMCLPNAGAGAHDRRAGAACAQHGDCASQWCETDNLGGICVEICCSDSACPNGTSCELIRALRASDGKDHWVRACVHTPAPSELVIP